MITVNVFLQNDKQISETTIEKNTFELFTKTKNWFFLKLKFLPSRMAFKRSDLTPSWAETWGGCICFFFGKIICEEPVPSVLVGEDDFPFWKV